MSPRGGGYLRLPIVAVCFMPGTSRSCRCVSTLVGGTPADRLQDGSTGVEVSARRNVRGGNGQCKSNS